jgi:ABC-type uncharacterized transport system auxiliary subunit
MNRITASTGISLVCLALLAPILAGCLSSNPPETVRYFLPPLPAPADAETSAATTRTAPAIRLGHVGAALHLGDRMVWRISDVEVAPDDSHHWAEAPATLVENALRCVLVEEAGLSLTQTMDAPVLSVQVAAFEGNRTRKTAVVELRASIQGKQKGTVRFHVARGEAPVNPESADTLARAMGPALQHACSDLAEWLKR